MSNRIEPTRTIAEGRQWLRDRLGGGATCPCCDQYAKEYKRKITRTMVKALGMLYAAEAQHRFVHSPTALKADVNAAREVGKLAYWGLVEEETTQHRVDGGRAGYWKVTQKGVDFLRGAERVPRYAHVYNGRVLGHSGPQMHVRSVAPAFNLAELMEAV